MTRSVLVLNAGSSSLKFCLVDETSQTIYLHGIADRLNYADATLCIKGQLSGNYSLPDATIETVLSRLFEALNSASLLQHIVAVGHRVVHGGEQFRTSALIDDASLKAIERCSALAPLHNPANLAGIYACRALLPNCPQVAVFDTAFHQSLPPSAFLYGVPRHWYTQYGVRRYGFHGTSHRYIADQAARRLQRPVSELALISAHLGNGCSACAILNGESIDTTMGLTPLEGLVMGTRCGDIDPSLPHYLARTCGWTLDEIQVMLNSKSGLLGISELSNDMRTLEQAAKENHVGAKLAIDLFCYRLAKSISALTVALGRLDALIFTGGIGEHSNLIRAQTVKQLGLLNLVIQNDDNMQDGKSTDGFIQTETSRAILVIPTNEEIMIARDTFNLIHSNG